MSHTPPNMNRQLHALLHRTGLMHAKPHLVESFTQGRTQHSSQMHTYEMIELIQYLKARQHKLQQATPAASPTPHTLTPAQRANRMRRKLIAMAHTIGWHTIQPHSGATIADMQRINLWCCKYGYLHKPLNSYTLQELPTLLSQFETYYKSFLKSI